MWGIELDPKGEIGLSQQIYRSLKERILSGRIAQGEAIPSTRELADALGVSRNTVNIAYDMLWTEGFILRRQGAPSRVADGLQMQRMRKESKPIKLEEHKADILWDFRSGQPDLNAFPWKAWNERIKEAADSLSARSMAYSSPKGWEPLCGEIAAWLFRARNMEVDPADIYITSGATQALYVLVEILRRDKLPFALENPSHQGVRTLVEERAIPIHPMRVDEQGADVASLSGKDVAAVYVTPSHQFPLGSILTATRRAALIRMAVEKDFYIIEDDYDSEFRYTGLPISPIYTMDSSRVVYVGTFSKTMFPALRIGFAVLPKALQGKWRHTRTYLDVQNPMLEQAALKEFLRLRLLDRHVRQMRRLYGEKRGALLDAVRQSFGDAVLPWGDSSGLHIALQFTGYTFGSEFMARCRAAGIRVTPLSRYCLVDGEPTDQLLLGYGHLSLEQIQGGIRALGKLVSELQKSKQ